MAKKKKSTMRGTPKKMMNEDLEKEPKFIELPDDYPTDDDADHRNSSNDEEEWVKVDKDFIEDAEAKSKNESRKKQRSTKEDNSKNDINSEKGKKLEEGKAREEADINMMGNKEMNRNMDKKEESYMMGNKEEKSKKTKNKKLDIKLDDTTKMDSMNKKDKMMNKEDDITKMDSSKESNNTSVNKKDKMNKEDDTTKMDNSKESNNTSVNKKDKMNKEDDIAKMDCSKESNNTSANKKDKMNKEDDITKMDSSKESNNTSVNKKDKMNKEDDITKMDSSKESNNTVNKKDKMNKEDDITKMDSSKESNNTSVNKKDKMNKEDDIAKMDCSKESNNTVNKKDKMNKGDDITKMDSSKESNNTVNKKDKMNKEDDITKMDSSKESNNTVNKKDKMNKEDDITKMDSSKESNNTSVTKKDKMNKEDDTTKMDSSKESNNTSVTKKDKMNKEDDTTKMDSSKESNNKVTKKDKMNKEDDTTKMDSSKESNNKVTKKDEMNKEDDTTKMDSSKESDNTKKDKMNKEDDIAKMDSSKESNNRVNKKDKMMNKEDEDKMNKEDHIPKLDNSKESNNIVNKKDKMMNKEDDTTKMDSNNSKESNNTVNKKDKMNNEDHITKMDNKRENYKMTRKSDLKENASSIKASKSKESKSNKVEEEQEKPIDKKSENEFQSSESEEKKTEIVTVEKNKEKRAKSSQEVPKRGATKPFAKDQTKENDLQSIPKDSTKSPCKEDTYPKQEEILGQINSQPEIQSNMVSSPKTVPIIESSEPKVPGDLDKKTISAIKSPAMMSTSKTSCSPERPMISGKKLLSNDNVAQNPKMAQKVQGTLPRGDCVVCFTSATFLCSGCQHVFYCGKKHQREHWTSTHKRECASLKQKPYRVERSRSLGRYLVATRSLGPHELILSESPLVVAPRQLSLPVCLGCHGILSKERHFEPCRRCAWPMCSRECSDSPNHVGECRILAAAPNRMRVSAESFGSINMMYASVAVLRVLALKSSSPSKWSCYTRFESHLESRMRTEVYTKVNKEKIVFFIQHGLGLLSVFSDLEILEACGKLDTNCFEIKQEGKNLRAMYETACIMSHDCLPNTKHVFDSCSNISVLATRQIEKGEVISANYTQALWTTVSRREHLNVSKCFMCVCKRCQDPTENNAFLAAIKCKECGHDRVLPLQPLDVQSDWSCAKCGKRRTAGEVRAMMSLLTAELKSVNARDPAALEHFLTTRLALSVSDSHQLCREIQYALVFLVGSSAQTASPLLRRLVHCTQLIELADCIEPGYTRLRGQLLMQWVDINIQLDEFAVDHIHSKKTFETCLEYLALSQSILEVEADFDLEKFQLREKFLLRRLQELQTQQPKSTPKTSNESDDDNDDDSDSDSYDDSDSDTSDDTSDSDLPGLI